ncbi:MAG TPA: SGNH/GDSL hydrolase family protein, partial [Sphingobacteriaceae bacterium]
NEIDAKMFVLDCLPNLGASSDQELETKLIESVTALRQKHPKVPILLTGHSGFIQNRMNSSIRKSVTNQNKVNTDAYNKLIASGMKDLYILPGHKVDMGTDGTVDGSHPTDFGMYKYAKAYEEILSSIFKDKKKRN